MKRWLPFALLLTSLTHCQWVGEHFMTTRIPCDYYVPEGYVGWVALQYRAAGSPPLESRNGRYQIRFPHSGHLATSSPFETGTAHDRYFYYSPAGSRELPNTAWGEGGMIWAGEIVGTGSTSITERFFVGTEQQYRTAVGVPALSETTRIPRG